MLLYGRMHVCMLHREMEKDMYVRSTIPSEYKGSCHDFQFSQSDRHSDALRAHEVLGQMTVNVHLLTVLFPPLPAPFLSYGATEHS